MANSFPVVDDNDSDDGALEMRIKIDKNTLEKVASMKYLEIAKRAL
jgi:hypothetical protein